MEVNLALLLVGGALAALLTLLPVGLRQSDLAVSDTAQAAFVATVFNAMHANASTMTNWTAWQQFTVGTNIMRNIMAPTVGGDVAIVKGVTNEVDGYIARGYYIKYKLTLEDGADGKGDPASLVKRALIQVIDRRFADVDNAPTYATAFVFMGM